MSEPEPSPAPARARWSPGGPDLLVALLTAGFAWRPATFTHDTWWHLRLGRRILDEPWFPQQETFSWTAPGATVPHVSWLCDVLFAAVDRLGGLGLLEVLGWLLIALVLRASYALSRALGAAPSLAAAGVAALAWCAADFMIIRPHLLTFLGFELLFLAWVRGRDAPLGRAWWAVPPLVCVWANLHGGFLLGLAFLGGVAGLELLEGRFGAPGEARLRAARGRTLLLLACAALAASCLHPQGPSQLLGAVRALSDPAVRQVDEWLPTPLRGNPLFPALLLLTVVAALFQPRRPPAFEVCAWLGSAWLALNVWRHLPLFGIVGHGVLAAWATRALDAHRAALPVSERLRARLDGWLGRGEGGPGGWVALLVLALLCGGWRLARPSDPFQHPLLRARYPVETARWVLAHDLHGRMFHSYRWGAWLGFVFEDRHPVYLDSRLNPMGWRRLEEYFAIYHAEPGWEERLAQLDVSWMLLEADAPLVPLLRLHPGWRLVHEDAGACVFVRLGEGNDALPPAAPAPPAGAGR